MPMGFSPFFHTFQSNNRPDYSMNQNSYRQRQQPVTNNFSFWGNRGGSGSRNAMPNQQQAGRQGRGRPPLPPPPSQGSGSAAQNPISANKQALSFPQQSSNIYQQPLPDGVTIQPLDPNLLKNLPAASNLPTNAANDSENTAAPPNALSGAQPYLHPSLDQSGGYSPNLFTDRLVELIQNERNAHEFYTYLSQIAPLNNYSEMLKEICRCCNQRKQAFNKLYHDLKGNDYVVVESQINKHIGFNDGIRWAIFEENKGLRNLVHLYEETENPQYVKILNNQITYKICDLIALTSMQT